MIVQMTQSSDLRSPNKEDHSVLLLRTIPQYLYRRHGSNNIVHGLEGVSGFLRRVSEMPLKKHQEIVNKASKIKSAAALTDTC